MSNKKGREGSVGRFGKKDLIKQSLQLIEEMELTFIDDLAAFLPCSRSTFYNKGLHLNKEINEALGVSKTKHSQSAKTRICKRAQVQQSKNKGSGYLYLVRCKGFDFYKIGISKISIEHRLSSLQTGCPFDLEVLHVGYAIGYKSIEVLLHNKYRQYSERGEWFKLNDKLVSEVIKDIDKLCSAKNDVTINVTFGEQINIF